MNCCNSQVKAAFHYALLSLRFVLLLSHSRQDRKCVINYCIAEFLHRHFHNVMRCSNGTWSLMQLYLIKPARDWRHKSGPLVDSIGCP